MAVREKKGQLRWSELGRTDLRKVDAEFHLAQEHALAGAASVEEAILVLEEHLGFDVDTDVIYLPSPVGNIAAHREHLLHIVEKRVDARERYVKLAVVAMADPYEIWRVEYDDGSFRHAFIGLFEGRTQMLVIVIQRGSQILWNFMHCEHKSLNKHWHGTLVYERPRKTKGEPIGSPEEAASA